MPVLVVGDLNTTPFSPYFDKPLKTSGLRNSQRGFGYQGTWPSTNAVLRIPIDHVLHSPALHTLQRRVGPYIGSDQLPVRVTVGMSVIGS